MLGRSSNHRARQQELHQDRSAQGAWSASRRQTCCQRRLTDTRCANAARLMEQGTRLEAAEIGGQGGLVADRRGDAAQQCTHLAVRLHALGGLDAIDAVSFTIKADWIGARHSDS